MITDNNSWSLGFSRRSFAKAEATPNKSLDSSRPGRSRFLFAATHRVTSAQIFGFRISGFGFGRGSAALCQFVSHLSPLTSHLSSPLEPRQPTRPTLQTRIFLSRNEIF